MSTHSSQESVDKRNRIFTIVIIIVTLFLLAVLIEKNMVGIKSPDSLQPSSTAVKQEEPDTTEVVQKTSVRIRPLVTRFQPLPNFRAYEHTDRRKAAFIDYLTPIIEYQNEKILKEREHLEEISKLIVNGEVLCAEDSEWLRKLAENYGVKWAGNDPGTVVLKLAPRVDIIPVSLALVQAAKESSWGRSRYAVEANNIFGQWCFDAGCGVVPAERDPDATHEVKRFRSVTDATRSYIHNLNTHPQYKTLREIRQRLRMYNKKITGKVLANGLHYYSERRQAYVDEVKTMIEQYRYFQQQRTG